MKPAIRAMVSRWAALLVIAPLTTWLAASFATETASVEDLPALQELTPEASLPALGSLGADGKSKVVESILRAGCFETR